MKQPSFEKNTSVENLIFEYEALSQRKSVPFFEETAFSLIANWYYENGFLEKALNAVDTALRFHRHAADFHIFRAQLLLERSNVTDALSSITLAQQDVEGEENEKRALLFRAEAFCVRGNCIEALHLLKALKMPVSPEKNTAYVMQQARLFERMEEYGKMYDMLAELAIRQPDNEDLLEQVWFCVELGGNYRDSIALHETVLDRHPYSYHAWHNLGHAHLNLDELEEALDAFEYSFITNPYFEAGYREFGALAFRCRRFHSAMRCYQEMVENLGEDASIFVRIGECYQQLGDWQIARAMYEKALKLDPYHAEAYFRIGECFADQKEYRSALKWLRQAIQNEDRREDFHAAVAEVLLCLGKNEEALEHFWKAVEIAPDEQRHWTKVARCYMAAGQPGEALEVLDQAIENAIERNELLYCRSACLFLLGNRQKALKQLRQALSTDFRRHETLFCLAPDLAEDKDVRRIIKSFQ